MFHDGEENDLRPRLCKITKRLNTFGFHLQASTKSNPGECLLLTLRSCSAAVKFSATQIAETLLLVVAAFLFPSPKDQCQ